MKLRTADPFVIVIGIAIVSAIGGGLLAIYYSAAPRTVAERIDVIDVVMTRPNVWLLRLTDADGQHLDFGYFDSKVECDEFAPQVEAEWHTTNGRCMRPSWRPDPFSLRAVSVRCPLATPDSGAFKQCL